MPLADEFQTTSAVLGALRDIAPFEARPYELLVVGAIEDAIVVE
jgi:hypothetical protein